MVDGTTVAMGTMNRWFYGQAVPRITRGSQHTSSRTGAPFCPSFSTGVLRNLSPTQPERQFQQPGGVVLVRQGNMDGENWWKVKPKYSTKVLIGNWVEDRARVRAGKIRERVERVGTSALEAASCCSRNRGQACLGRVIKGEG